MKSSAATMARGSSGDRYQALAETYVIFITENDTLGYGLPIYHIDRIIRETGSDFGDESHIIYVNAQIRDETALGRLMHDFACTDPQDMYYDLLARRVHYFKADEKGVAAMCKVMEDMRDETARAKAVAVARNLLAIGKLTYEEIARSVDLTVEEVKALDSSKTA